MAIIWLFQSRDAGSIPATRSRQKTIEYSVVFCWIVSDTQTKLKQRDRHVRIASLYNIISMHEKHYLVKEYMSTRGITISETATLRDAVALMLNEKTNGAVVTNGKKIVGILSSWDIITQVVPDYLESDEHLAAFEAESIFAKRVKDTSEIQVKEFMTKTVHTVKEAHTLVEAATLLAEHGIRQLPVVNEQNEMVGYINRTDIKRAIGDVLWIPDQE